MELEAWLPCLLVLLLFFVSSVLFFQRKDNLPPGPRGWPIVGNLFQLGSKPHATLSSLARTYGPLFSLRLGTQCVVVASSPSTAALVLKTHERSISARAVPQVCRYEEYLPYSIVWSDCNDSWKQLRAVCRSRLFSGKMLDNGVSLRQQKVEEMVRRLRSSEGEKVCIPDVVFSTIFSMMAATILSDDAESATGNAEKMKRLACRVLELSTTPNVSDYFPAIAGLDVQGLRRESMACYKEVYDIWEGVIVERKKQKLQGGGKLDHDDFLGALLASGLSDLQIKACLFEMFIASTDTTTTTIEWAMAEFMKQPKIMAKLRKELFDTLS
ncbi:CYP80B3 protein [Nymphaea thermarum]|nr:CYP80B3 protein [Nymphaea thermarum]